MACLHLRAQCCNSNQKSWGPPPARHAQQACKVDSIFSAPGVRISSEIAVTRRRKSLNLLLNLVTRAGVSAEARSQAGIPHGGASNMDEFNLDFLEDEDDAQEKEVRIASPAARCREIASHCTLW